MPQRSETTSENNNSEGLTAGDPGPGDGHRGALSGIRVLDLTRILSGPFATMVLGDLGAEVIKVENITLGDDTRQWAPPYQGDQSAYFLSVNRNKRSVSLDLKSEAGLEIARQIASTADILVENFRPGTAARLGLGYPELSELNPRLIYASISGYGQTGPLADQPGYDAIAQALSGMMSVTGPAGGEPCRVGVSSADIAAGMWTLVGILAALESRHRSGQGQHIDVALLDGQIAWLTYVAGGYLASGMTPPAYGSAHPTIVPYQAFPTTDGYVMVAVGNDTLWKSFAPVVGLAGIVDDPRFATNPDRVRNRATLLPMVADALAARSSSEWVSLLADVGVPAAPINTVPQALEHPQVRARNMVVTLTHPTVGRVSVLGNPVKMSADPPELRVAPPLLGQHTDEVLTEIGLTSERIRELRTAGAIR